MKNWDRYDLFGGFWKMPSNIFSRSEVFDAVVEIWVKQLDDKNLEFKHGFATDLERLFMPWIIPKDLSL
jgi:hypothetical protein